MKNFMFGLQKKYPALKELSDELSPIISFLTVFIVFCFIGLVVTTYRLR